MFSEANYSTLGIKLIFIFFSSKIDSAMWLSPLLDKLVVEPWLFPWQGCVVVPELFEPKIVECKRCAVKAPWIEIKN